MRKHTALPEWLKANVTQLDAVAAAQRLKLPVTISAIRAWFEGRSRPDTKDLVAICGDLNLDSDAALRAHAGLVDEGAA